MKALSKIVSVDGPSADQTLANARLFHRSADELIADKRKDKPWAPYRVLATQAIELYLNAYLLRHGITHSTLKGLQHDFAKRGEIARAIGLNLRSKTFSHLSELTERNEYVAARYTSYVQSRFSAPNRVSATLIEVANEVTANFA